MKDLEALYETMRKNMKRIREEAGVSKRELAKEIGMDRASYSKFESGQRGIGLGNFYAFSQFFNVSMDELLKD